MADPAIRLAELLQSPDTLRTICAFIANGGTLTTLCTGWEVTYSDVWSWLFMNEARKQAYTEALQARSEWEHEVILAELRAIALFDLTTLYAADGTVLPISAWPKEAGKAIVQLESLEERVNVAGESMAVGQVRKLKAYDKLKAIELLGKTAHLKLFVERHEMSMTKTLEQLVADSQKTKPTDATGA